MMTILLLAAVLAQVGNAPLPVVVVTTDDTVIDRSCVVRIAPGAVIADANGDGVIQIRADGIRVEFEAGSVLRGAPVGTPGDAMTGIGIRVEAGAGVTLRAPSVSGYKVGIHARGAPGFVLDGANLDDHFRQRLRSTPRAEDGGDWLWPHKNDGDEWATNYGGAVWVEESDGCIVRNVRVRRGQNGIVLDRVQSSKIYDNDCSFLSGWGVAMWRSSGNVVSRNALDFCVRGYSHGVYNRGQDSAGLLMFEQCGDNLIAENSATHGGDGFFGFAGHEALGENPPPPRAPGGPHEPDFDYTRRGNNDNLLINNDFSYAPAHGIEMTFSFGNRLVGNRLVGNAICGVWGGYSQGTLIAGNTFAENGGGAYGLERGGVNIEHGFENTITRNLFRENTCGVHLWSDADTGLMETPWAKANHQGSLDTTISGNTFEGCVVGVHLRDTSGTRVIGNVVEGVGEWIVADEGSTPEVVEATDAAPPPPWSPPAYAAVGEARPVGAREHLRGREKIIMTEWGPWDHQSPLVRLAGEGRGGHVYEVFGSRGDLRAELEGDGVALGERPAAKAGEPARVEVCAEPGVRPYMLRVTGEGLDETLGGTIIAAEWTVRVFPWTVDPREDLEGWRAESRGPGAIEASAASLDLRYGGGGPRNVGLSEEITAKGPGADRFGTIAATRLPLTAGRWRVTTTSDDGVRVLVDGAPVVENWTWHGPARDAGEFAVEREGPVEIVVEHFEIDGHAVLAFDIERVGEGP